MGGIDEEILDSKELSLALGSGRVDAVVPRPLGSSLASVRMGYRLAYELKMASRAIGGPRWRFTECASKREKQSEISSDHDPQPWKSWLNLWIAAD